MLIKYLFLITGVVLALLLMIRPIMTKFLKDNMKIAFLVSCITIVMFIYVLLAFIMIFVFSGFMTKTVMLILGLSPFIIGKCVTFEKVLFYSIMQIAFVLAGVCYTLLL